MATEEVCSTGDVEEALLFKVVENIIVDVCDSYPQVSPKPLDSGKQSSSIGIFKLRLFNAFKQVVQCIVVFFFIYFYLFRRNNV